MPRKDPEARREYSRQYTAEHREEARLRAREWYYSHREDPEFKKVHEERGKKWKEENREEWLAWRRNRRKERLETEPEYREKINQARARYRAKKFPAYREIISQAKSGGCSIHLCQWKEEVVIDLHHIDPSNKKYSLAQLALIPTLDDLRIEIAKCVPICSNHHRMYHAGLLDLPTHITSYRPTKRKNGLYS